MTNFLIIGSTVVVLAIIIALHLRQRRIASWVGKLRRLHAGVAQKAEWMASDDIVLAVEADYLAAQHWMAEALMSGYMRFLREASEYLSGTYFKDQQQKVQMQLRKRGPRIVGIVRAHHNVRVRHFSDDGFSCYVIDHQREQRMATYDYWERTRLHTQDLGESVYVYRMVFDRKTGHWKIDEFTQQLPLGWKASSTSIRLEESLPAASGRDI